ncbi:histidyl-tRNA synthetase [Rubidibacter lacunae KORDI 51-2]|uniref:Histidine--tRNA ligase n=1 Tax=Rubidibacter lacunae KORDI 51-2 TaxID=582515 RepID=U5DSP4_9CHRO|nr:histidine--tRNA ligase [Rubidibacter lacunae]ERN42710.1 histidyl-tRNA synthetase [Rubidibacter lacunae KORDI 51-2]
MGAIQALRGTRDILPEEVAYWQRVEAIARGVLDRAAYREVRSPLFEQTELFARGIGEATDVVGKEMYTFRDRGDRSVTLRPEGTAGIARAFIEHGLHARGTQRLWYGGAMFRYERPQAGRQRQFHQLGLELIGCAAPRADVETIAIATDILRALGLQRLRLQLNSVGDAADRQRYRRALIEYLTPYKADLDADSQGRLERNPLRILDSKDERTRAIVADAPSILDALGSESQAHFTAVQQQLSDLGIDFALDPCLVRGLDYYTHTAFEIQSDDLGAQATVCGGGRYNGLIEQLGGPVTPAVGWAIGIERLVLLLQELTPPPAIAPDLYVVSRGDRAEAQALVLAQKLRHAGFAVELDLSGSGFAKQFKRADRSGAIGCLVLGEEEAATDTLKLKWLPVQEQTTLPQAQLLATTAELHARLNSLRHQ